MIKLIPATLLETMSVLKIINMRFIPYTSDDALRDWKKQSKKKKRRKQYASKVHKNLNSR